MAATTTVAAYLSISSCSLQHDDQSIDLKDENDDKYDLDAMRRLKEEASPKGEAETHTCYCSRRRKRNRNRENGANTQDSVPVVRSDKGPWLRQKEKPTTFEYDDNAWMQRPAYTVMDVAFTVALSCTTKFSHACGR
ncbi:unnamed protein product [Urochloa humidicola]